jgi:hypothetical protein
MFIFLSDDVRVQFEALQWLRRLLSRAVGRGEALEVIESNVFTDCCMLASSPDSSLQYGSLCVVTSVLDALTPTDLPNLTFEDTTLVTTTLCKLLQSPLTYIVERACRALGYIAGVSREVRNSLLFQKKLLRILSPFVKIKVASSENVSRTLSLSSVLAFSAHQLLSHISAGPSTYNCLADS